MSVTRGLLRHGIQLGSRRVAQSIRVVVLACGLVAGLAPHGHAGPGELDATFGGLSLVQVGENVMCHAVAPDERIVLAGNYGMAPLITRRLANGDVDPSFSGDGSVVVTNLPYGVVIRSVAVQADGKIVVAGTTDGSQPAIFVARIAMSGSLDPTFSGDGFTTVAISYSNGAEKVLIQPDGKIVAVGRTHIAGDADFAAARFNPDGTLDTGFGGDGHVAVGFGGDDEAFDAVLQADGKLIMVGSSEDFNFLDKDFAIARLHANGALDGSFDGDGKLKTGFGDVETAYAVAIQPTDLRIVVAGRNHVSRYYSSDGSLDGTFDGDGKLTIPITATDAAVTTGGKITLIGIGGSTARALRLNANGSLDPEWQGDGDVSIQSDVVEYPSLSILADGRVLTAVPKGADCSLRRYWADGYLDTGGRQAAAFDDVTFRAGSQEIAHDMAVQANGRIVLVGEVSTAGNAETDFAVTRFLPDGQLDTSFGVRGRVALSLGNYDVAKAVAIQPDGKIVVAGYTGVGNATNFMIARFNSNGSIDNTFGFGGFNVMDFMAGPDFGWALALLPDGRIIVAGTVFNGARNVFGLACFNSNGAANSAFDLDGKQLLEFSVGPSHWASSVVVQNGTRIIVGGSVGGDFALAAFTLSGAVDNSFGGSGKVIRNLGGTDYLEALALGPDGMIYAAGSRVISGNADWALARWISNGSIVLCPIGFCGGRWTDERAFVDFGSSSGWVDAIHVRSDGHIIAAGTVANTARWAQFSPNSSTPVASGLATYPGIATAGNAVRFAGPNQVLVAGSHYFQGDRNMALSRFETIPATVGVEEVTDAGPFVRLYTPTPNPLVNRATFAFDLPRAQAVRLAIYDASGRQVRTLMNGSLMPGRHQRLWDGVDDDGRPVAAGIYFARLDAGADQARTSVVVLR